MTPRQEGLKIYVGAVLHDLVSRGVVRPADGAKKIVAALWREVPAGLGDDLKVVLADFAEGIARWGAVQFVTRLAPDLVETVPEIAPAIRGVVDAIFATKKKKSAPPDREREAAGRMFMDLAEQIRRGDV